MHLYSSSCSHLTAFLSFICCGIHPKKDHSLSSVLVIKYLCKYGLPFPRMHSKVDSFDSCVIFLVSSRQKKLTPHCQRLHTHCCSFTCKEKPQRPLAGSQKRTATFYMYASHNLPSVFGLECLFWFS